MSADTSGVFQEPAVDYQPRGRLDPAGFAQHVRFRTVPPPAGLGQFLAHFWIIRWDVGETVYHSAEVMHRPYVDVFLGREQSGIQGTFRGKRIYPASGRGRIVGARFLPGAFRAFWSGELSNLQDRILPLDQAPKQEIYPRPLPRPVIARFMRATQRRRTMPPWVPRTSRGMTAAGVGRCWWG